MSKREISECFWSLSSCVCCSVVLHSVQKVQFQMHKVLRTSRVNSSSRCRQYNRVCPLVCSEWLMSMCALVFRTVWTDRPLNWGIICLCFLERSTLACRKLVIYAPGDHFPYPLTCVFIRPKKKNIQPSLRQCASPWLQMDRVHKALIGSGFGLTSPLKRKASSCGVCRLRFSCEVGVYAFNCFAFFSI